MFDLLFFMLFGYLVMNYEKPIPFAAGYAVTTSLLSILLGRAGLFDIVVSGLILFGFTALVYIATDRQGDKILVPIGILIVGYTVLVFASYYLR